jgi:hypothetical protein
MFPTLSLIVLSLTSVHADPRAVADCSALAEKAAYREAGRSYGSWDTLSTTGSVRLLESTRLHVYLVQTSDETDPADWLVVTNNPKDPSGCKVQKVQLANEGSGVVKDLGNVPTTASRYAQSCEAAVKKTAAKAALTAYGEDSEETRSVIGTRPLLVGDFGQAHVVGISDEVEPSDWLVLVDSRKSCKITYVKVAQEGSTSVDEN